MANSKVNESTTALRAFQYYSGYTNPTLEFNGGDGASLINVEDAEPFVLAVRNATAFNKSFYLSQGFLYTRGSETPGQLKTGAFPAIGDASASLTASTTNSVSIEQFIAYTRAFPTYVPLIQCTTTNPTAELTTLVTYYLQGMIKNEAPTLIPVRKYARGDQYNLQFLDFKDPIYLSEQDIVIVTVAANSTLVMNLYPLVSKSDRKELSNDILNAAKLLKR